MNNALRTALIFAQPLIACASLGATLDVSQITLTPPAQSQAYLPRETLTIKLAGFNPIASGTQLSLELDTIDVTAMASLSGNTIAFSPVKPLSPGHHELRLVAYQNDGSISELGYWTIDVRAPTFFRNASFSGQATLNVTQRLGNSTDFDHANEYQIQGSASYQTEANTANAQFSGRADLLYINTSEHAATGKSLDLGTFVAHTENDYSSVTVGHQTLSDQGLMFDGYQKRGVAVSGNWQAAKSQLIVFGMSSQDLAGHNDILGINDEENRYHGGLIKSQLWQSEFFESHLISTYMSGKRTVAGYGSWSDPNEVTQADGWGLTLDNYWFERQLRMRLEGAGSDSKQGQNQDQSDDAYSALVVINPTLTNLQWQLGVEAKEIGANYYSLANPYLPTDRNLSRLFTSLSGGKWNATASAGREITSLDQRPERSTTAQQLQQINVSYSDYNTAEAGSIKSWIGNPSYTLSLQQSTLKDDYTSPSSNRQDSRTETAMFNAAFTASSWQWNFGYSLQTFDDFTNAQIDSRIHSLFANMSLRFGEAVSVQPGFQRQRTDNRDYGSITYSTLYNLAGQFILIPRRLSMSLSWNQNAIEALNDPFYIQDNNNQFLSGNITWQARLAKANKVGIELALSASSQDYRDHLFSQNNNDSYQVFLTIKTTLPSQFTGGL
ncbi:hypothetical protein KO507_12955 [Gilvimarinus agarilyticus]|uniref:hypothetical protein n=1 Tax=Gilvimarinus sp. 2_MG-2023 TaxID=3062666 RepID=UPI001C08AC1C|nr:hypothetical protein [Gilvimarinus sp. 2_MG-2023]MBU2886675.1 hypothetical protein [Gilvimarinus agarilyticus]MDO6571343.1 hypothetical protein [Gilvimarinus sp. 2_MG-2023]